MNNPVLILYLEDNPRDAELVRDKLQQIGMGCELRVAIDRAEYEAALDQTHFDLILSDYSLPGYDGMSALALARVKQADVPFILISGTLGEEQAVDCVLRGATDFVLKQRLNRLVLAVVRALAEAEEHQKHREVEEALRESEVKFRLLAENIQDVFWISTPTADRLIYVSPAFERIWGRPCADLYQPSQSFVDAIHPEDKDRVIGALQQHTQGNWNIEYRIIRPNGEVRWILDRGYPVRNEHGDLIQMCGIATDITERKKAEEELRENEERFKAIANYTVDWENWFGTDGQLLWVNPAVERITGYSLTECFAMPAFPLPLFAGEDRLEASELFQKAVHGGYGDDVEFRFVHKDGSKWWGSISWQPIFDSNGKALGYRSSIRDITKRKWTEEELKKSKALINAVVENVPHMIFLKEATDLRFVIFNRAGEELLGYDRKALLGKNNLDLFPPEQAAHFMASDHEVLDGETGMLDIPEELILTAKKGQRLLHTRKICIRGEDGTTKFLLGISEDITERKKAEDKIEGLSRFPEENPAPVLRVTAQGVLEYANPAADILLPVMGAEVGGAVNAEWQAHIGEAIAKAHPVNIEFQSGNRTFSATLAPIVDHGYVNLYIRDITERKKAEEEIKRNYEIQAAMNALLKLSIEINNEKEFLDTALNLLLSLKWLAFESKGSIFLADESKKTLHLQVHRGFSGELLAACSTVPFGRCLCGKAAAERTIQFADCIDGQHVIHVEGMLPHGHYCVPILSGDNVLGVINLYVKEGHIRDLKETEFLMAVANVFATVIERKRAEAEREKMEGQLGQLRKMEAIGQLAGGVAHDFNNMLAVINGYSEMMLMELPKSDTNYSRIQEICNAGHRSADLTRQLLAFARRQTIELKVLDMNDTVTGMLKMLQRLIGENIKLTWNPVANLWKVKMDPSQLDQILANLLVNARDAISSAGKVVIETGKADLDQAFCAMHPGSVPGKYVVLEVSDNGCGMSKETVERIFEPFFTTKKVGEGTGLGLATVFGIVKQNNGFINVYSEPGKGTTFKIYLPRHESENGEKDEMPETPEMLTGTETVLLVEDENAFLIFAKIQLERLGYAVLDASSPVNAIKLAGEYKGEIHLLITDVVMPEMSGRDLKEEISSMRPGIKTLFMSGYTKDIIARKGVLDEGIHFLQKPFTVQALSVKLREALA
ncbi:MAG TPA: hypothetical protein DCZ94_17880 [Lentisphaeria bacterium]|nr:hypothetical protein [Lentisphaeria bacterium]